MTWLRFMLLVWLILLGIAVYKIYSINAYIQQLDIQIAELHKRV